MADRDGQSLHTFEVYGQWSGAARRGEIGLGGPQTVTITLPQAFGGTEPGTNPEELLLGAALSCYIMTLARVLARRGFGALHVETVIVGQISRTSAGPRFERIILRPVVHGAPDEASERERIEDALLEAEEACFIARTLRPAIPYVLEPRFAAPVPLPAPVSAVAAVGR